MDVRHCICYGNICTLHAVLAFEPFQPNIHLVAIRNSDKVEFLDIQGFDWRVLEDVVSDYTTALNVIKSAEFFDLCVTLR